MTLAKRIIPTMLCRGRTLVKGKGFAGDRSVGHVMQAAKIHAMRGVDELLILDIGATAEGRSPDLDMVRELTEGCYVPVTVGGGVKTLDDIDRLLRAGADKVCFNSAFPCSSLVEGAADRFGRQAIVVSLDIKPALCGTGHLTSALYTDCGSRFSTYENVIQNPVWWARVAEARGAGEILLQSIERDGTMSGYDLDLIRQVSAAVTIPVIASGGCSGPEDMLKAIQAGADAVAAGALFQFTDETPRTCAQYLKANGVEVRL